MPSLRPLVARGVGVALIILGLALVLLPFLPGLLLLLAGAGFLSPRARRAVRALRDRFVYRRMGGR